MIVLKCCSNGGWWKKFGHKIFGRATKQYKMFLDGWEWEKSGFVSPNNCISSPCMSFLNYRGKMKLDRNWYPIIPSFMYSSSYYIIIQFELFSEAGIIKRVMQWRRNRKDFVFYCKKSCIWSFKQPCVILVYINFASIHRQWVKK